jgi:hypothetical protein
MIGTDVPAENAEKYAKKDMLLALTKIMGLKYVQSAAALNAVIAEK